jgi:uncharacterized membrane protein YfhO
MDENLNQVNPEDDGEVDLQFSEEDINNLLKEDESTQNEVDYSQYDYELDESEEDDNYDDDELDEEPHDETNSSSGTDSPKPTSNKVTKKKNKIITRIQDWAIDKRYYFLAFMIPFIIMYVAYALFEAYPAKLTGDYSVLVLDLNGQYVYYFEYFRDAILGGDNSIFYSWERNFSGEFMGIIGYYLASPFTLITLLFPQKYMLVSLFLMQLCKLGTQGVTMSFYLQNSKKMKPLHSVIFSTVWGVCGYAVVQLMDPMWLDGLVFLPIIVYGIEKIIDENKKAHFIISLAWMFVANFYIGYMLAIFSVLYFLYYYCFGTDKSFKTLKERFMPFLSFGVSAVLGAMLSAFMLLPVYYSLKLGKFDFTEPDYSLAFQFTAIDVMTRLLPSCYDTVRNEGLADIYCGVICILMTPLYILNKKVKANNKIGYTILLAIMFFSMYIKPIDMLWHGGQVPNWLPYRYSFIISFLLIAMSAEAFKNMDGISGRDMAGVFAGFLVYILWAETREYENLDTLGSLWLSVALVFCFAMLFYGLKNRPESIALPVIMLLVVSGELTFNASNTLDDIHTDVCYSKRSSYEPFKEEWLEATSAFNEEHEDELYRSEKTYVRTVNDNLLLGLKGITHSSSTMNAKAISLLGNLGYVERGHYTQYYGSTLLLDDLFGIKYVFDTEGKQAPEYVQVDGDYSDTISVYENTNALPIGYMVSANAQYAHLDDEYDPFNNQNKLITSMMGVDTQAFKRLEVQETRTSNVSVQGAGDQTKYEPTGDGDHTVDYIIKAESDDPIYLFFPAHYEKQVNIWYSTDLNTETNEFENYEYLSVFFEGSDYYVRRLGSFEAGQYISVRCTITGEYCYMIDQLFYQIDEDLVDQSVAQLAEGGWNITKHNKGWTKITAEVTAQDNQILFTSIPLETGWTIKVDGKKVEAKELYDTFIGIPMSSGTHTVTLSFFPAGLGLGIVLFIIALPITVVIVLVQTGRKPKFLNKIIKR